MDKTQENLENWCEAQGIPFINSEAEEAYKRRARRIADVVQLKIPDRVPITHFSKGERHVQFNVVNKETLADAQKHPENHHDLVVRVAGYSAYFVTLGKPVQDEIIGRTEYSALG